MAKHPRPRSGWQQASSALRPRARLQRSLRTTRIGGRPVTLAQWQRGDLARALGYKGPIPGASGPASTKPSGAPAPAARSAGIGPLPIDPTYDADLNAASVGRDQTLARLAAQRKQTLADFGYNESGAINAATGMGTLQFDVNNPFSKAALLKSNYDTQRRSVGQSMGAGGQLYSGAYQNAQDLSNRNQLQAQDSLQKSLAAFLAGNTTSKANTEANYQTQVGQLGAERLGRVAENPLYEPTLEPAATKQPKAPKAAFKSKAGVSKSGQRGTWHIYPDGRKVFVRS